MHAPPPDIMAGVARRKSGVSDEFSGLAAAINVPPISSCSSPVEGKGNQGFRADTDLQTGPTPTLCVIQASPARRPRRKAGKRGPKGAKSLTREQVWDVREIAGELRHQGRPFNIAATVRPRPDDAPAEAKRTISRRVAHLNADIAGHGVEPVAITIFECQGGFVHANYLAAVPRKLAGPLIARWNGQAPNIFAQPADAKAVDYATKQRPFDGPFEKPGSFWARGEYVPGPRIGKSTALRLAFGEGVTVRKAKAPPPQPEQPAPQPPVVINTDVPRQLPLFGDLEPTPTRAEQLRRLRMEAGMTQTAFGELIGLRQPHVANVERGHDPVASARLRAARWQIERQTA